MKDLGIFKEEVDWKRELQYILSCFLQFMEELRINEYMLSVMAEGRSVNKIPSKVFMDGAMMSNQYDIKPSPYVPVVQISRNLAVNLIKLYTLYTKEEISKLSKKDFKLRYKNVVRWLEDLLLELNIDPVALKIMSLGESPSQHTEVTRCYYYHVQLSENLAGLLYGYVFKDSSEETELIGMYEFDEVVRKVLEDYDLTDVHVKIITQDLKRKLKGLLK